MACGLDRCVGSIRGSLRRDCAGCAGPMSSTADSLGGQDKPGDTRARVPTGVLGARSLVGTPILEQLTRSGRSGVGFSRSSTNPSFFVPLDEFPLGDAMVQRPRVYAGPPIGDWISAAPIWVLPKYFGWLESAGARRIVALSSTSLFTKVGSGSAKDREVAARLLRMSRE